MSFKLSVEAEEDIITIAAQGVRLFGVAQARRYHDDLYGLLDLIAGNPLIARERDEIHPPVRVHPFKVHLVVYRIEDDDSILIIRIRHGHDDWASDAF
ncbi:type II toxin-antitoxin system RelE/ParE family toxin [Rhizobium sp. AN80A]|uniref:type II toxin-antitoxin system RelE/ParE family toxin n=1 Tax=Rhizobium sp. AN80A TaxID=3040673 RepID=UPI0024B3566E|nr:type II toxin-antitoxin system RelE/ParE family toxin [Rhizobium sp. AN80A]